MEVLFSSVSWLSGTWVSSSSKTFFFNSCKIAFNRGITLLDDTVCSALSYLVASSRGFSIFTISSSMDHSETVKLALGPPVELHKTVIAAFCSKSLWSIQYVLFHRAGQSEISFCAGNFN